MRVIGITGGIGAGKTQVLRLLKEEYGAYLILADEIAHDLMEPGHICYESIVKAFGNDILSKDGLINRNQLSKIIFHDKEARMILESIVHPAVKRAIIEEIAHTNESLVIIEAALLIENNYKDICDELWYVYAPTELRMQRLVHGRGYSREKSKRIMDSQLSEEVFRRHCDKVIDNAGMIGKTRKQLEKLLNG